MQDNAGKLLNIKAAAEMLAVAPTTLYMWASSGRIPHIRLGRCIRFQVAQLLDYINNNAVAAAEKPPKLPAPRKPRRENRSRKCINNNKFLEDLLAQVKKDILDINQ
jgi:excisionase family DNA binding protein